MHVKQFHRTGTDGNFIAVTRLRRMRNRGDIEFQVQVYEGLGDRLGVTRAVMTDLHQALGEMLGLGSPAPTAPLTASKPAKNPRRVNGGL